MERPSLITANAAISELLIYYPRRTGLTPTMHTVRTLTGDAGDLLDPAFRIIDFSDESAIITVSTHLRRAWPAEPPSSFSVPANSEDASSPAAFGASICYMSTGTTCFTTSCNSYRKLRAVWDTFILQTTRSFPSSSLLSMPTAKAVSHLLGRWLVRNGTPMSLSFQPT